MLDFDIELAKLAIAAGSGRIVTREGKDVRITDWNRAKEEGGVFSIVGEIKDDEGNFMPTASSGVEASWTKEGKFWRRGVNKNDLFIEELC